MRPARLQRRRGPIPATQAVMNPPVHDPCHVAVRETEMVPAGRSGSGACREAGTAPGAPRTSALRRLHASGQWKNRDKRTPIRPVFGFMKRAFTNYYNGLRTLVKSELLNLVIVTENHVTLALITRIN